MKNLKFILSFILIFCQLSLTSKSLFIENNTSFVDSTHVRYFYGSLENLDLGHIYTHDTTTLLSSYYEPLENQFVIYQTLTNSGLAHKNISFFYPINLGFNHNLTSYASFLKVADNI